MLSVGAPKPPLEGVRDAGVNELWAGLKEKHVVGLEAAVPKPKIEGADVVEAAVLAPVKPAELDAVVVALLPKENIGEEAVGMPNRGAG